MSKHTPGPWTADKVSQGYVFADSKILIAAAHCQKTHYCSTDISAEQMMANAHLIAAAPDLLKACIKAHDALLALHVCNQDKSFADETRAFLNAAITAATE